METLEFALEGKRQAPEFEAVLVGVVGSGNLEVLVENGPDPARCTYSIHWNNQRNNHRLLALTLNFSPSVTVIVVV